MESILSTLAFVLLIAGQFLAAIVLISNRKAIYGELEDPKGAAHPRPERIQATAMDQELPAKA